MTLTGPPGVGKTRLAIEVAVVCAGSYSDGTRVVDLAALADPGEALGAVALALGVQDQPGRPMPDKVLDFLSEHRLLLVLDNAEHLIDACAHLVNAVLSASTSASLLVTSQEPLGVAAEQVFPVAPLAVPGPADVAPDTLLTSPAGRVFRDRAVATRPDFTLNSDNASAVAEICRRLDGIPLAIELAAARVGLLSPSQIASHLDERFRLLTGGRRTVLPRHRTLLGALNWSHDLLSDPERALLRRLSVFACGWSLDAATEVCAGAPLHELEVLDTLGALVAKSLVVASTPESETRYRLLETVRLYALDRLSEADEIAAVRTRHIGWCVRLAEQAEPGLTGPEQETWLARLQLEHENIRAALRWALEEGESDAALRLAGALTLFWRVRGYFSEGRQWLDEALVQGGVAPSDVRAKALWGLGFLALGLDDHEAAVSALEESLAMWRHENDAGGSARCLLVLGNHWAFKDPATAVSLLTEGVELARQAGDSWCLGHSLAILGLSKTNSGDRDSARAALEECLAVARRTGDKQSLRLGMILLGTLVLYEGDYGKAEALLGSALAVSEELGELYTSGAALGLLGVLAMGRGDYVAARTALDESLRLNRRAGRPTAIALALCRSARLAQAEEDKDGARSLLAEATDLIPETSGFKLPMLVAGQLAMDTGDLRSARNFFEEGMALADASADCRAQAELVYELANLDRIEGDHERAAARHHQAFDLRDRLGDVPGLVNSIEALAGLAVDAGRLEEAVRLFGAAQSLRNANGYSRWPGDMPRHEADLASVRTGLPAHQFEAAWEQGAALSITEVVSYASRSRGTRGRPATGWASLTRAQRAVAELAGEALTNAEIAARLFISPRTVETHLTRAFAKLGVASRTELARDLSRSKLVRERTKGGKTSQGHVGS